MTYHFHYNPNYGCQGHVLLLEEILPIKQSPIYSTPLSFELNQWPTYWRVSKDH